MKIVYITDLTVVGSGYMSLSLPICVRLAQYHELKVIGLGSAGEEHQFDFSIFPAADMPTVMRTAQYLYAMWPFDVMITALDIPIQDGIIRSMANRPFKYVGIFPVEADPLCLSWSMALMNMDKQFVISEFGTNELHKRYIESAQHLPIGIDTSAWVQPTEEQRSSLRHNFGIEDDEFVVITVADNQERKNLWMNMKAFALFAKDHPRSRYILVTRENFPLGWKLRDLALDPLGIGDQESSALGYNISDKLMIFERGLPFKDLWRLYAMADAHLLLSKAEGLGLPLMEAMSVGVPNVGTNCTGISELLGDGRGILVSPNYIHIDPFGNGRRYHADPEEAANGLHVLATEPVVRNDIIHRGLAYVSERTWEKTVEPILEYVKELENGKEESQETEQPIETFEDGLAAL